jgi:hypothetical protein
MSINVASSPEQQPNYTYVGSGTLAMEIQQDSTPCEQIIYVHS